MGLLREDPAHHAGINLGMRDPLGFLVRFVQTDLDGQTKGEWMDLRWRASQFATVPRNLGPIPVIFVAPDSGDYQDDSKDALYRRLQDQLREIVDDFVSPVRGGPPQGSLLLDIEEIIDGEDAEKVHVDVRAWHHDSPVGALMTLYAPLDWIARLQAQIVLQADGPGKVKKCPHCGSFFVKVRRQKFCSTRCTNKASMATYLAKRENLQKHRDSSHLTYAKKKRAGTGPSVKIRRQPRKGR